VSKQSEPVHQRLRDVQRGASRGRAGRPRCRAGRATERRRFDSPRKSRRLRLSSCAAMSCPAGSRTGRTVTCALRSIALGVSIAGTRRRRGGLRNPIQSAMARLVPAAPDRLRSSIDPVLRPTARSGRPRAACSRPATGDPDARSYRVDTDPHRHALYSSSPSALSAYSTTICLYRTIKTCMVNALDNPTPALASGEKT
jgi:hypothetical protein